MVSDGRSNQESGNLATRGKKRKLEVLEDKGRRRAGHVKDETTDIKIASRERGGRERQRGKGKKRRSKEVPRKARSEATHNAVT